MHSRASALFVAALVALLALAASPAAAYSNTLSICEVTEADMSRGMGGQQSDLGFKLQAGDATSGGTSTTVKVLAADPTSQTLKGLLLWATDANGKRVGTWKLRDGSQGFALVKECNGGAVSHTSAAAKSFKAGDATNPEGFVLTVPADAAAPVTVRAAGVGPARIKWQIMKPLTVAGLGKQGAAGSGGSTTPSAATTSSWSASLAAGSAGLMAAVGLFA
ncbi:hypothetical protein H9P43_000204 [Blastocladiella emersonii ATCC 22665]|nr:hypothetical protein H9P43_000204 [Blastocladiella emersonii ATCC 22665]